MIVVEEAHVARAAAMQSSMSAAIDRTGFLLSEAEAAWRSPLRPSANWTCLVTQFMTSYA